MKFLYLATLTLCLSLVLADGESGSNPAGNAAKILQSLDPAKMCPQISAAGCKAQSATCIDIPNLVDCAQFGAMCQSSGESLCQCLSGCGPDCAAKVDCSGKEGVEAVACKAMTQACVSECESACPVTEVNKLAQGALHNMNGMIVGLSNQIKGLLGQKKA